MERLRGRLEDRAPLVRVEAATELWEQGRKDGVPILLEALSLRPLRGENLEAVRRACEPLGKMRASAAVKPLRALLSEDLSRTGSPSHGLWPGRPDAVALARMGDEEGIRFLERTLSEGDAWKVVGRWPATGDIEAVGLRRLLSRMVPFLGAEELEKRVHAARAIVRLIDAGK